MPADTMPPSLSPPMTPPMPVPSVPAAAPPGSAPPSSALASPPLAETPRVEKTVEKSETGLTEMVSGIVTDFQKLISQQIALLRAEVRSDWEKSKRAMMPMIIGALCMTGSALLLSMTAALALHWSFAPPGTDPSRVPLWACFGIVGVILGAIGGGLVLIGTWAFQSFNPLPNETAAAFEDNIKALTESRVSPSRS